MHPLEADITLPDGRTMRFTGKFVTDWRKAKDEGWETTYLRALQEYVNEYTNAS